MSKDFERYTHKLVDESGVPMKCRNTDCGAYYEASVECLETNYLGENDAGEPEEKIRRTWIFVGIRSTSKEKAINDMLCPKCKSYGTELGNAPRNEEMFG